jgi:hypothetical protein
MILIKLAEKLNMILKLIFKETNTNTIHHLKVEPCQKQQIKNV